MKKEFNIGLIGAGRIGKMHAENILTNFPQIKIRSVVDKDKRVVDWVKEKNVPRYSDDIRAITDDPKIDAVIITTPSNTHVQMIETVARAGKNIFCEKPVAFKLDQLQKAIDSVKRANVVFQVGFNRRFDPDYCRIRKSVKAGLVGNLNIIRIISRDPKRPNLDFVPGSGGLFMDFCTHDFDLIRFITGEDVEEIYVKGANLIDPKIGELGDIDTALITLKLKSGVLCYIDVSRETNYGYDQQLEVFGSKGSVSANNIRAINVSHSTENGISLENLYPSFIERYRIAYLNEIKAFIDCLINGTKPLVGGIDAYKAVELAIIAKESLNNNKPVRVVK